MNNSIILKGEELEYWKKHSNLINILAENLDALELKLEWFPDFTKDDFNFLKGFLHKKNISFTNSKKYGTFIYNIKAYTGDRAEFVLDYIMYMKPKNVTEILKRKQKEVPSRKKYNGDYSNYSDYNNNISSKSKKDKYKSNIKINNNDSIPYAKKRSKTLKKKSKKH